MGVFDGKRILIAEDEIGIVEALRGWFAITDDLKGAVILTAQSADEAEAYLLEGEIDIALLDLNFGEGITGLEILQKNKGEIDEKCKIFIYSGYPQYKDECLANGAVAFIEKGTSLNKLTEIIKQHITGESK